MIMMNTKTRTIVKRFKRNDYNIMTALFMTARVIVCVQRPIKSIQIDSF